MKELTFKQQKHIDKLGTLAYTPSSNSNKARYQLYAYVESLMAPEVLGDVCISYEKIPFEFKVAKMIKKIGRKRENK